MKALTRNEAIEQLVDNDINTIIEGHMYGDHSYINDIFRDGFKGYDNFSDEALRCEFMEIFGDDLTLTDKNTLDDAKFVSVWDDGVQFIGDCKYNRITHEIFDVDLFDVFGVDICVEEYVLLNDGTKIPFTPAD